ncbi:MAG: Flp family type IVb pilin [Planctomycetota bacterium]|nr:Flp family type IVb pilin [Planctomycetota bacterium]
MYRSLTNRLRRLLVEEDGPTAVEYAVMVSLIAGACIATVGQVATATKNTFNSSSSAINGAMSP